MRTKNLYLGDRRHFLGKGKRRRFERLLHHLANTLELLPEPHLLPVIEGKHGSAPRGGTVPPRKTWTPPHVLGSPAMGAKAMLASPGSRSACSTTGTSGRSEGPVSSPAAPLPWSEVGESRITMTGDPEATDTSPAEANGTSVGGTSACPDPSMDGPGGTSDDPGIDIGARGTAGGSMAVASPRSNDPASVGGSTRESETPLQSEPPRPPAERPPGPRPPRGPAEPSPRPLRTRPSSGPSQAPGTARPPCAFG